MGLCSVHVYVPFRMTKSAIRAFREKNGLKISEEIDTELLEALGLQQK